MTDAARPIAVERLLAERAWVEALARSLVLDDATADDVVQQTWLAAIENPPREEASRRGWLSRVVRNAASESRRRAIRRERWESMTPSRSSEPSPEEVVAKAEAHRRVVDAVMSLEEPYRSAVLLRFFEGLESDDVARRTGVPIETARTRIKRALVMLRARLDRDHGGDGRAWAFALLPLTGTKHAVATSVAGGAVVGVSMKTAVAASAASALLAVFATRAAMSLPEETETPPTELASKQTAEAPRPVRRGRRDAPTRETAPTVVGGGTSLAKALDEIPVDLPPRGAGVISGHVKAPGGAPIVGVVVRAYARPDAAKASSRSIEDEVRVLVTAAKWRTATMRGATTDAEGAYEFADVYDARHVVDASIDGCDVVPATTFDPTDVRPGATADFAVMTTHVRVAVLMPDATPATEKVLVRCVDPEHEGRAHPRDWWWTPENRTAPIAPGRWTATATIGTDLRSKPIEFTTPVVGGVPTLTLRLEQADASQIAATAAKPQNPKILSALDWLQKRQSPDGGWGDPTTTGVALLPFLGAGETHQSGSFRIQVKDGLKYLRDHQDPEGCFVEPTDPRRLRDHAVAALAMVEAWAMTQSRVFKEPAQKAVAFALKTRGTDVDVETTAWMVLLAKSAQASELGVDKSVMEEAVAAIDRVTDRATGRVVASNAGGTMSDEAATAIGVLARIYAGRTAANDEAIVKGAALLSAKPPTWESGRAPDYAAWYFGTLAAYQVGGDTWRTWNAALKTAVLDRQRTDGSGDDAGSWESAGATETDRTWATALNTLCAEVYLRYGRVVGVK